MGLIKNSLHLSLGKVSEKLAAIVIIPLLTGVLTQEQYGQLVLSYSFSSVYIVVVTSGLNTWLFNDFTKSNFNLTEKSLKTLSLLLITGTIGITLLISIALYLFFFNTNGYNTLYLTVLTSVWFTLAMSFRSIYWVESKNTMYLALYQVAQALIVLVSIWYFSSIGHLSQYTRPVTELICGFVITVVIIITICREINLKWNTLKSGFRLIDLRRAYKFGFGAQSLQLTILLLFLSDRFIVQTWLGSESLAVYSVGSIFMAGTFVISAVIQNYTVIFNQTLRDKLSLNNLSKVNFRISVLSFLGVIVLKTLLFYFDNEIVILLTGKNADIYGSAKQVMWYSGDFLYITVLYYLYTRYHFFTEALKKLNYMAIIVLIFNVLISFILIKFMGISGVMISSILSIGIMVGYAINYFITNELSILVSKKLLVGSLLMLLTLNVCYELF